ncbi:MAG: DNA helicase RecQ [Syntrophaceticus sp.]|jgi:ATP-dependent DNA helicase RecQ|nr:DNA helicase RecQ [Syntrophaceticus sp.]MDD3314730.1 DNA helicase RecQ [Syntrophaceticus sp.]MDD4360587.1 DNA helicase RecQ [Syntrophaceticus sp.]MDD4782791.1 DNA helicase RecQ [Syntrophaceticus sp.]
MSNTTYTHLLKNAKLILKKHFGYPSFRKGQEKIIANVLQGQDTICIMPTGGGKSICYQIPALLLEGTTIVISPLISLMKDQVDTLQGLGMPATFINSSIDYHEAAQRFRETQQGKYKLLYIAPERLMAGQFSAQLTSLPISLVAIDEAHCISQWGHDFRPSYRDIMPFLETLPKRPVVTAFTATATPEVTQDIIQLLRLQNSNVYIAGFDRENLFFSVVRGENKRDFLLSFLQNHQEEAGIIYTATRKEADNLYEMLGRKGYAVGRYHAGLSDQERSANQEKFLYDDLKIIVATNAFGMGIDKSNVRYVIHYNMPKNMEAYYQEAGRAGRDGDPSNCILLFSPQDTFIQRFLIEQSTQEPARKEGEYKKLRAMIGYCYTPHCLRNYILHYFGEETTEECGKCGTCNDEYELQEITIEAQKILSCVIRMKERFGISLIADVLKGSQSQKVLSYGFDKLSTYGLLSNMKTKEITDLINYLLAEQYITLQGGQFPVVKLTRKAVPALKSQEKVYRKVRIKKETAAPDSQLFEKLRTLRKGISQQENIPPYVIFHDFTLREMAEICPTDQVLMLAIKGMGETKFARYGYLFLEVIRKHLKETGSPQHIAPNPPTISSAPVPPAAPSGSSQTEPPAKSPTAKRTPSYITSYMMYQEGDTCAEIAQKRSLTLTTVQDHIIRSGMEGYELDWDALIPQEYEELILEKVKTLGTNKLRPIKDALPDKVSYLAIRAVIGKYGENTQKD